MSTTATGVCERVAVDAGELQILMRVDRGGMLISEGELRYQLDRKDDHPLAREPALLDVLVELELCGLIASARCFWLTAEGRARLAELADAGGEG